MNTSSQPKPPTLSVSPHTSTASGLAALAALRIQRTHPAAWLWLSLFVVAFDQATKFLVTRFLELYERVEVLPVLDFMLLHNTGAAFSILATSCTSKLTVAVQTFADFDTASTNSATAGTAWTPAAAAAWGGTLRKVDPNAS